jgi:DNA invertase Pin-like site-specific DNA recombinase
VVRERQVNPARREIDAVAAWSVDRLGRSLQDLVGFLVELHEKRVDLYLHQQGQPAGTGAHDAVKPNAASATPDYS